MFDAVLEVWRWSKGSSRSGREHRVTTLYSVDPNRIATMMQSCASAAKLRGGRLNLLGRHKVHGSRRVTATSDHHRQLVAECNRAPKPCPWLLSCSNRYDAERRTTPYGTTPVVTNCQSAMSSLRASATIIVFRLFPAATRAPNHCARALRFWWVRKRQASWTMPRRTRALPALDSPFSRRRAPLSSGAPVRPA
jgi:hypothetical protein